MSFSTRRQTTELLALATSAQDARRESAWVSTDRFGHRTPLGAMAACHAELSTGGVVATFSVEVSDDQATVFQLKPLNNPAIVATPAAVTTDIAIPIPAEATAMRFVRVVAVLSGAGTNPADQTSVILKNIRG